MIVSLPRQFTFANDPIVLPFASPDGIIGTDVVEGVSAKYCQVGRENPSRVFSTKVDEKLVLLPSLGMAENISYVRSLIYPKASSGNSLRI